LSKLARVIQTIQKVRKSVLVKNIASLGFLQISNYIIPLLIIPFIARVLGVEMIGKVSYAQGIIAYFTIIVNYGFEFSGTQQIAIHRDNPKKINQIFWNVTSYKFIFLLLSFLLLFILNLFWDKIKPDFTLYFIVSLTNIGIFAFPAWFLQGLEKMGYISIVNFIVKALGGLLIILLVKSPNDFFLYAALPSISFLVIGLLSFIYVIKKFNLSPFQFNLNIGESVKDGFPIFLNNLFISLYTTANFTILGFYVNDIEVGIYSGAQKIISAALMVTSMPINIALFPNISRKINESPQKGFEFLIKTLKIVALGTFLVSLFTYFLSPLLVQILLGDSFADSILLLQILSPLPFLVSVASLLSVQGLYGFGFKKFAPIIGAILGISCVLINIYIIPIYGTLGAATSWVIIEVAEIMIVGLVLSILLPKKLNEKSI